MEQNFSINIRYKNKVTEKTFDEIPLIVEEAILKYLGSVISDDIEVLCVET